MARKGSRFIRIIRVRYRRMLARIDRNTPVWMQWIAPYGTSLTLHGVFLLALGITYLATQPSAANRDIDANIPQQLVEDLTSLKDSDHAGDPFATNKNDDPLSISLDPNQTDDNVVNVPELPADFKMGPDINVKSSIEGLNLGTTPSKTGTGVGTSSGPKMAPFSSRGPAMKARMNIKEGGSIHSEKAVQLGLAWLARHQKPDGSWSLDPHAMCKGSGCPRTNSMMSDTAATGLALLPLLGAGHSHVEKSSYQQQVQKAIDWLVKHQKPDGDLFIGGGGHMYSHAIGTMALCEAYGVSADEKLKAPAQKAIDFIIASRCKTGAGGWRYEPGQEGDTSVFGWQMFALRSAALSNLTVPLDTIQACRDYLDKVAADPYRSTYSYTPGSGVSPVMTAEGLLCRQYLGWHRNTPAMIQGGAYVVDDLGKYVRMSAEEVTKNPEARNIYYWYYATQMLHNMQGPAWQEWNLYVRESLIKLQTQGTGCDKGSWDPLRPVRDRWGSEAGRHFLTCMSLLTLEVYYRYLPLYAERDRDVGDVQKAKSARGRGKDSKSIAAKEKADKLDKERAEKEKAQKPK